MLFETLFIGIVVALLFVEITDVYPGGIIVPLALLGQITGVTRFPKSDRDPPWPGDRGVYWHSLTRSMNKYRYHRRWLFRQYDSDSFPKRQYFVRC